MTRKKEIERMARQAKKRGMDPEKVAPTKSENLRAIFMAEYSRYTPRGDSQ